MGNYFPAGDVRLRIDSSGSHHRHQPYLRSSRNRILRLVLRQGVAIGVLISFIGGLMAIDLVPRKATGAALGIVGMASYAAAGIQNIVSGLLLDGNTFETVNKLGETVVRHDFTYVSWFWFGAAVISFLLPVLNWRRKQQEI